MKVINYYNKSQLLKRIHSLWNFKVSPALHDIPLPVEEVATQEKTITIPLNDLTIEEIDKINCILDTLSSHVYVWDLDHQLNVCPSYEVDFYNGVNIMYFDYNLKWVICSSMVLGGAGAILAFGGSELISFLNQTIKGEKEWEYLI